MIEHQSLLQATREWVTEIFRTRVAPKFLFHNLGHTQSVVAAAEAMAAHYTLSGEDRLVLLVSAWFHDTGFASGKAEDHEKESARLAREFLEKQGQGEELIQRVSSCIQATKMPQSPLSQVEKIMCDADLYHLGAEDYRVVNALLKAEQEAYYGREYSKAEWRQRNIEFLESHQYFTDYAQSRREPRKQEILREMRKKAGEMKKPRKGEPAPLTEVSPYTFPVEGAVAESTDMKKANKDAERGIQTIFRTTSNNHIQLSQMADTKASILISVNAIIISIMLSVLLGRIEYYPHLAFPTILLSIVSVTTIVFSVLSIRPSVTSGMFTEEDIRAKKTNLLFFGNFHRMNLEEYQWAMNELLRDREYIYGSMVKDIYFLGVVLARKYGYLRWAYNVFMFGMVVSVIVFGVVSYLAK